MNKSEMLRDQYRLLKREYDRYSKGEITQEEYIRRARPIDETIDNLEMATLRDIPASKESSSPQARKPKS